MYFGDHFAFPEAVAVARLNRAAEGLQFSIQGMFCDFVADAGSGAPGNKCIVASVVDVFAPIELAQRECDCGAVRRLDDRCEVPTGAIGTCAADVCPAQAGLCHAL
jgi:hypothetical protein